VIPRVRVKVREKVLEKVTKKTVQGESNGPGKENVNTNLSNSRRMREKMVRAPDRQGQLRVDLFNNLISGSKLDPHDSPDLRDLNQGCQAKGYDLYSFYTLTPFPPSLYEKLNES